jgi:hypothetical protein
LLLWRLNFFAVVTAMAFRFANSVKVLKGNGGIQQRWILGVYLTTEHTRKWPLRSPFSAPRIFPAPNDHAYQKYGTQTSQMSSSQTFSEGYTFSATSLYRGVSLFWGSIN